MKCCEMKGFLTYLILWNLNKRQMTGVQLAAELEKRKGIKPSPGTIYPALKELKAQGFISSDEKKTYTITAKGKRELKTACSFFCGMFYDIKEMHHFSK
ncbi:MAG: PadR family transcriptional regulator [Candidatus Micrarchaeia archaeon]|jgi:DNA-binding PadR family transcriptional regulator